MNSTATQRKRPVAGIGFGQQGFYGNRHFSTVDFAEAAYDKICRELRNEEVASGTGGRLCWTHGSVETPLVPNEHLVRGSRFRGKLKSGKLGKTVHTVKLYLIDSAMADRFMADPWYSVEA